VWLIAGVITLIAALSYGELAGMIPDAGGQYVYLREAYSPFIAFLYGWTLFMVIQTGTIAAVAVAFAKFTSVLIPWFSTKNVVLQILGLKISSAQLLAIVVLIFLTFLNIQGVRLGKIVQNIFTSAKTIALIGLIGLGIFLGMNSSSISANFSQMFNAVHPVIKDGKLFSLENLSGFAIVIAIGGAMVGSLFSSDAWNNITFVAGEVKNPKRNIPLSLFYGTLIVTVLYILANVAYLFILPIAGNPQGTNAIAQGIQFATDDRVATAAITQIFSQAAVIMAVLIMVSTFGCSNGMILAGARAFYAMANDNLFFQSAKKLNKNGVPSNALVFQCIWASVLCLSGTYGQLLDYVVFTVLIFYIFTIAGVFILRKKRPDAERPYKVIGYPFTPILYIVLAFAICLILLYSRPDYTFPGLIIVLIGIPVYYVWRNSE
jgi:APA family basic amino acid/polyamine antiporter